MRSAAWKATVREAVTPAPGGGVVRPTSWIVGVFFVLALLSVGRDLQWSLPSEGSFIGHADQANVANIARNIVEGRGPVVDNHWLLTDGGLDDTDFPHPEPYWSVYVAYVIAGVMLVFGPGLASVLIAASLVKVLIAAVGSWLAAQHGGWVAGVTVAVILLFDRSMVARVNGLADIYWALSATVVFAAVWAIRRGRGDLAPYVVAGLAIGIGFGFRLPAILTALPLVWIGAIAVVRRRWGDARSVAIAAGAAALGALPYVLYNLTYSGTVIASGIPLVRKAEAIRSATGNHNLAFYSPAPTPSTDGWLPRPDVAKANVSDYLSGLLHGQVLSPWLLVAAVASLVVAIVWCLRSRAPLPRSIVDLWRLAAVWVSIAGIVGTTQHYEGRYWTFLVPVVVVVVTVNLVLVHPRAPLVLLGAAIVAVSLQPHAAFRARPAPQAYETARIVLPDEATVLTSDPWEFAFHTRLNAVTIPYTSSPKIIENVASRYKATFLVVVDGDLRHPDQDALVRDPPPTWKRLHHDDDLLVFDMRDAL